ncbi:hypothetical protein ACSBR1_038297 [Camellia fascicularis]
MEKGRQGGWIPVLNRKERQGGWRNEANARLFTIFVDAIPSSMNSKMVFDIFRKLGVVKDVYILQKRRKVRNTRFAFVRYDCEVAAEIAVQKANGIWVEDTQLEVKHADYGKETMEIKGHNQLKPKGPLNIGRGGSCGWQPAIGTRSYVEVTKNTSIMGEGILTIKAEEIGNGWLYDSVVVCLKSEYANINLKAEFQEKGMENILVRDGGGRDVLLTFKSKEKRKTLMGTIKEWVQNWCEEIVEWEPGLVRVKERKVWLCCYGLPWNMWNKKTTLNRIVSIWGEVICNPESFECARIPLVTRCMEPINKVINLECKGSAHSVRVWEQQSGLSNLMVKMCNCRNKLRGEEICSTNHGEKIRVGENARDVAEEDDDRADESAQQLDQAQDMSKGDVSCGSRRSDEMEKELPGRTEMVVAESASIELEVRAEGIMKVAGHISNDCELGNQKSSDQGITHCFVKSLSSSSLLQLGVELEAELGLGSEVGRRDGLDNKRKWVEVQAQGLKSNFQCWLKSVVGPMLICSDISQTHGDAICLSKEIKKKKRRKSVVRKSMGKKIKEMKKDYLELAKRHGHNGASSSKLGPKGAIWRAAATVASVSSSSASGVARDRKILEEAKETLQLGKLLGVNYKGKEEEMMSKIMELEAQNRARIGEGSDAAV